MSKKEEDIIGKLFTNNYGEEFKVLSKGIKKNHYLIEFIKTKTQKEVMKYKILTSKSIFDDFHHYEIINKIFNSSNYGKFQVIDFSNPPYNKGLVTYKIKFLNTNTILENKSKVEILDGRIRDPYAKVYFGVGYLGIGKYNTYNISAYST